MYLAGIKVDMLHDMHATYLLLPLHTLCMLLYFVCIQPAFVPSPYCDMLVVLTCTTHDYFILIAIP